MSSMHLLLQIYQLFIGAGRMLIVYLVACSLCSVTTLILPHKACAARLALHSTDVEGLRRLACSA